MDCWKLDQDFFNKIISFLYYLVVCYAGSDTKLMRNTPSFKRSHMDRLLDKIIIGVNYFFFIF
jgi:hypothetical protein